MDSTLQTTFLKHALSGCEELKFLVNNVLDIVHLDGHMKPPSPQKMSVEQTVKEVLAQFDPRKLQNYELQVLIDETFIVWADAQLVRQVLRNLLSNAFKYTPQQTPIVISAQTGASLPQADVPASSVIICVRDHGPGIPTDEFPFLLRNLCASSATLLVPDAAQGLDSTLANALLKQWEDAYGSRVLACQEKAVVSTLHFLWQ